MLLPHGVEQMRAWNLDLISGGIETVLGNYFLAIPSVNLGI